MRLAEAWRDLECLQQFTPRGLLVSERDAGASEREANARGVHGIEGEQRSMSPPRLVVMFDGKIVAELDPKTASPTEIGLHMTGSGSTDDTEAS